MNFPEEHVNGFVLAGGKSRRMGVDKGTLLLGGRPLVQISADLLAALCRRVFLLAPEGRYSFTDLPCVADRLADAGPLAALASGLGSSDADVNLFVPCDMPFLTQDFLRTLLTRIDGVQAAVPRDQSGRWLPFPGVYRRSCLAAIESSLKTGERSVQTFFHQVVIEPVSTDGYPSVIFTNINCPEDLAAARVRESGRRKS